MRARRNSMRLRRQFEADLSESVLHGIGGGGGTGTTGAPQRRWLGPPLAVLHESIGMGVPKRSQHTMWDRAYPNTRAAQTPPHTSSNDAPLSSSESGARARDSDALEAQLLTAAQDAIEQCLHQTTVFLMRQANARHMCDSCVAAVPQAGGDGNTHFISPDASSRHHHRH